MSSKKKEQHPYESPEKLPSATAEEAWPEDFPGRATVTLVLAGLAGVAAGAFLFWILKLYFPGNRILASVDTRTLAVFTGIAITAAAGLLHASFGLAAVVLLRHWMDGITYPGDNAYFNCAVLYLFVLWGARTLLRGGRMRYRAPLLLLGGFLLVNAVTTFSGYEIATSYRTVLVWCSSFALFVLTANGLRSRTSISIIIGSLAAAELCHAIYAIIQFEYVFDYTRQWLMENPARLHSFFGPEPPTPELMRRLNLNRAFGTMLFPNALAAFLILAMPLSACGAVFSVLRHNEAAADQSARPPRAASFRFGAIVMLVSLLICFFATALFTIMAFMGADAYQIFGVSFGVSVLLGLLHGFVAQRYAAVRGTQPAAYGMAAYFFLLLLAIQSIALWRTYSRGAMLALFAATIFGGLLLWRAHGVNARRAVQAARALALALVLLGGLTVLAGGRTQAQSALTATPAGNSTEIAVTGVSSQLPIETRKLLEQGADISLRELLDPSSFSIRLSYWRAGLRMACDNLLLGVGPGNFATAYPKYQRIDSGDVDTAHNDYLQTLCETGLFGLLAFLGFWGCFVIWGGARVLRERNLAERWLLVGLYLGPCAFLLHCLVDFNFYNPSLVFYVFLVTGLFYGRAALPPRTSSISPAVGAVAHQLILLLLLVGAALAIGMNLRLYFQDYALSGKRLNVADNERINRRFETGRAFLTDIGAYGLEYHRARAENRKVSVAPPRVPVPDVLTFLNPALGKLDDESAIARKLEQLGVLAVTTRGGGWRKLSLDEPLHGNVWLWLNKQPWRTMGLGRTAAEAWLAEVEEIDGMFPHRPDLAAYIADWYRMLVTVTDKTKLASKHSEYLTKLIDWARICTERCPERAEFRGGYGLALWIRSDFDEGESRNAYCERAIEQYRIAQRLRPESSARFSWELSSALKRYGEELLQQGKTDAGRKFIDESQVHAHKAEKIQNERFRLGLP